MCIWCKCIAYVCTFVCGYVGVFLLLEYRYVSVCVCLNSFVCVGSTEVCVHMYIYGWVCVSYVTV